MCTCKDKEINTMFYFAPTEAEYLAYYNGNEIDPRTITFVAETGEIWKNGVLYGKMSEADLKNMIQKITKENPYILPIATKDDADNAHIGGVMGGKYITVNTNNGSISIDVYKLFSDPNALLMIKNTITKEYIENTFSTKATYDRYGIVKVKRDGGITVNDGVIQIDGNNLPDGLRGKDGKDGATPTIGADGYWYINGVNTGVKAKGDKGEKGDTGDAGTGGGTGQNINYLVDVQPWYLVTNLNEGVTLNTSGWTLSPQSPTNLNRYLWKKYKYTYSNAPDVWKGPFLEGSFGEKGDTGPTGPGGGFNPQTDTYIQNTILPKVEFNFNWINDLIDGEVTRIELLVDVIDQEIKDRITDMITDTQWIELHYDKGVIGHTDMNWDDAFLGYLLRVGLWETKLDGTHYQWSDIIQRLNSIEANVNTLVKDPSGALTTLQAALLLFSDESTAKVTLDTFWAKTNEMKEVISWLYSGLRGESASDHTFNDLISAAKGEDGGTAASNLHTGIERMLDGTFVAKGSLITELNGEIASGMLSQADPNSALATLFSKVYANELNYAELVGEIKTISDIKDPLNPYIEQSMIAKATMYEVEMKTIYEKDSEGVTRAIDVPVRYANEQCTRISDVDSENIYFKYIQDEDENHNALWVVTEENGIEYGGETYEKGYIVNFNPGYGVIPKWKVKSLNSSGFITRNDANIAYSKMFAKDKDDIEAKIELAVQNGVSGIEVHADNIEISAGYNLNLNAERIKVTGDIEALHSKLQTERIITETLEAGTATFEGNVNAKSFTAGELDGLHIRTQGDLILFVKGEEVVGYFVIAGSSNNSYGLLLRLKRPGESGYYEVNWDNWTSDTLRRWVNAGYYLVQAAGKIGNSWLSPAINPKFPNIVTNTQLASIYNMIMGTGSLPLVKQYLTSDTSESYINDTYNTVQDKNSTYPWFIGISSSGTQWHKYTTLSSLSEAIPQSDVDIEMTSPIAALGYTTEDLISSSSDTSIINIHTSGDTLTDPIYVIHAVLVTSSGAQPIIGLANESKLQALI